MSRYTDLIPQQTEPVAKEKKGFLGGIFKKKDKVAIEQPQAQAPAVVSSSRYSDIIPKTSEPTTKKNAPSVEKKPVVTSSRYSDLIPKAEVPVEKGMTTGQDVKQRIGQGALYGVKTGASQVAKGINEYNKWFYNTFNKGKGAFGESYDPLYEKNDTKVKEYENKSTEKLVERLGEERANSFVTQASAALGQGGMQLAAFAVNPVVGYTTIAGQTIGAGKSAYDEALEATGDEKIAKINGIVTGSVNSLEALPVFRLAGIGKDLLMKPIKTGALEVGKRLAGATLLESGTEGISEGVSSLTRKLTYDKEAMPLRDAINAFLVSIPTGILFGGAGEVNIQSRLREIKKASGGIKKALEEAGVDEEKSGEVADVIVNQYATLGDEDIFTQPEEGQSQTPENRYVDLIPQPETKIGQETEISQPVKVYRGAKKEVQESDVAFGKTLVFENDQQQVMRDLAESGNEKAKSLVDQYGSQRLPYQESDVILRDIYGDKYDTLQFNNSQLKEKGTEYFNLKDGNFYSEKRGVAELYAMQNRDGKYEKAPKTTPTEKIIEPKKAENLVEEPRKYKTADEYVRSQLEKDSFTTDEPITVYRGEGKGIGNSTLVKGRYFADSKEFAGTFGEVTESTIPKGSKIFDLDKVKNGDGTIDQEMLVDQDALTKFLSDNGFDYTKNTNTRGVEYVQLNKELNELKALASKSGSLKKFKDAVMANYDRYRGEIARISRDYTPADTSRLRSPIEDIYNEVERNGLPKTKSKLVDAWKKSKKEDQKTAIENVKPLEKELIDIYKGAGELEGGFYRADEALYEVSVRMELAEPGTRLFDNSGVGTEVNAVRSTFPKWVSEELRSTKLFEPIIKRLQSVDTIQYPTKPNATKQRALYNEVLDQVDIDLGVDTKDIRNKILKAYDGNNETEGDDNRSTRGDQDGAGRDGERRVENKEPEAPAYKGGSLYASAGMYRDGTPIELAHMDTIRPIEFPELVDLARELMGNVPNVAKMRSSRGSFKPVGNGNITIDQSLFSQDPEHVAKTLAHEIGHLVDYLPDKSMKRGNLVGRLQTLKSFMKNTFSEDGVNISNKEVRKELLEVTQYWKPYDRAKSSKSYVKYRESAAELYADAISMLFNSPGTLERMAPTFYKEFFNALDKKPAVFNAYFDLQALLGGDRNNILERRRAGVRKMFDEGDYKASELQKIREDEKKRRENNILFRLKFELLDKNQAVIDKVRELQKKGVQINDDDNPVYYLEERGYLAGKIKAIMDAGVNPIYQNLQKEGISWTDFGEALFYERIRSGDRSDVANPRGITPKVAEELMLKMFEDLGVEKSTILVENMERFRTTLRSVAEEAHAEGLYSDELYKQMQENPAYVTFQVIDHIDKGMTSKVHKSLGTLKDITNPADASLLKMISTVRAIERNKVNRSTIEFLNDKMPQDIKPAQTKFVGKAKIPVESRLPNEELVMYMDKGKVQGYYVDPYIKSSLDNESIGQNNAVVSILRKANSTFFRPLFIGFNLGFQSFNFVRDFLRFYKNIPQITFPRAMKRYYEAMPAAKYRVFGLKDEANATLKQENARKLIQEMESEQILSITYNDVISGQSEDDRQIDAILEKSGINTFKDADRHPVLKPLLKVLDAIKNLGDIIETLPKVAGYLELSDGGTKKLTKSEKSFIRKNIGSPDFLAGGRSKPIFNEVFLFANSIAQGYRSDINVAIDPKTRSAYWWKTAKLNILPKILMFGAIMGLFGDEERDLIEGVSSYDMTNYMVIPMGRDENGKTIYMRIPQDEGGRFVSAIFWKMLTAFDNDKNAWQDMSEALSFLGGQVPSTTPTITNVSAIAQYLYGQNPYDTFRARNVLSDDQFKAGPKYSIKPFAGWLFNQMGGGIFYRFYNEGTPREKTKTEKLINLPVLGNILGRFVRVSDYGKTEKLNLIKKEVESGQAQRRIDENKAIGEYIKKSQENPDMSKRALELELVESVFGGRPSGDEEVTRAKNIIKKFNVGLKRGEQNIYINSLISAGTNDAKVELLKEIKSKVSAEEYKELREDAVKNSITSREVFRKVEKELLEEKK